MLIIMTICIIFCGIVVKHSQQKLDQYVRLKTESTQAISRSIEEQNSHLYRQRIKSFVNPQLSSARETMLSAFERQNREELLRLTIPFLNILKKESPNFFTLAWILPNNHNFLRVHNPEKYGDDISKMRPDVVDANQGHQQYAGYVVAGIGLVYSIIQPVFLKGNHIGVVQFGLKGSSLLDAIAENLQVPVGIVMTNEKYKFIVRLKLPNIVGASHTIQSRDIGLFEGENGQIDWSLEQQRVVLQGKEHIIVKALELLDYAQQPQGHIFVALDISEQVDEARSHLVFIVLLSVVFLLLSFLILYTSYGSLIQKIMNLNRSLEQNNLDLEQRIEERTESLKKSEQQYKEAQQIAKLGHWELNLETDTIYWSDEICRIFDLEPQEVKATREAFLERIHPDDRRYVNKAYTESVTNKSQYDIEYRIVLKNGEEKWVNEKCSTQYDDEGKPIRSIGIVHDITEIKFLRGVLPICSSCKQIRDDQGYWNQIESYIREHSSAEFTHSICPDCAKKLYSEFDLPE